MKRNFWIALGIIILVALSTYAYLGGFNPIETSIIEEKEYQVLGTLYAGSYDRDTIENLFSNARELVIQEKIKGTLTIINFTPDESDSVKLFIGILIEQQVAQLPGEYRISSIEGKKIARARIKAHNLVMPIRSTVDATLNEFAEKKGYELQPIAIEQYLAEDELIIDRLLK